MARASPLSPAAPRCCPFSPIALSSPFALHLIIPIPSSPSLTSSRTRYLVSTSMPAFIPYIIYHCLPFLSDSIRLVNYCSPSLLSQSDSSAYTHCSYHTYARARTLSQGTRRPDLVHIYTVYRTSFPAPLRTSRAGNGHPCLVSPS